MVHYILVNSTEFSNHLQTNQRSSASNPNYVSLELSTKEELEQMSKE